MDDKNDQEDAICWYVEGHYDGYDECGVCGCKFTSPESNFCPKCGVKFIEHKRK